MRAGGPPRGSVLSLEPVSLPDVPEKLLGVGSGPERARWQRENVARRCVRLVYPDGRSAGVGLFVSADLARDFAREHGWTVLPAPVDGDRVTSGGLRA